jgi:hypothetical protein
MSSTAAHVSYGNAFARAGRHLHTPATDGIVFVKKAFRELRSPIRSDPVAIQTPSDYPIP